MPCERATKIFHRRHFVVQLTYLLAQQITHSAAFFSATRSQKSLDLVQRKTQLLRHFGSLKQVREASLEALSTAPGMPQSVARAVYDYFHPTPGVEDEEARQAQEIKVPIASA